MTQDKLQRASRVAVGEKMQNLDSRFRGNDGREKVDFESTLTKSRGFESRVVYCPNPDRWLEAA